MFLCINRFSQLSARSTHDNEHEANGIVDSLGNLENVRKSNRAYTKTKIGEFLSCYFAMIGLGSSVIAYEVRYAQQGNSDDEIKDEDWVFLLLVINFISTLLLVMNTVFNTVLYI